MKKRSTGTVYCVGYEGVIAPGGCEGMPDGAELAGFPFPLFCPDTIFLHRTGAQHIVAIVKQKRGVSAVS